MSKEADIMLTVDHGHPALATHFFAAGLHLLELLDDLADTPNVEWQIGQLSLGSAVSGLAAVGDHRGSGERAAKVASQGLAQIRKGQGMPPLWNPNALAHAKDLVRGAGEHAKIEVGGIVVPFDHALRRHIESLAPWVREFHGSVRGRLTGVNVTRGNRASISPLDGRNIIRASFPTPLAERMRQGLLHHVEVEGTIRQNEDGKAYHIAVEDVHILPEKTPSWGDLQGIMPEITEGLTIAAYLESIRGDEE
ncbi:MAG: hypothetical protein Q4D96_04095 [Propionibacteriaceae bacterium]|nr:hypothetical protein [Propionibacteriaceae bacterium]